MTDEISLANRTAEILTHQSHSLPTFFTIHASNKARTFLVFADRRKQQANELRHFLDTRELLGYNFLDTREQRGYERLREIT